jgi:hypothetical protein
VAGSKSTERIAAQRTVVLYRALNVAGRMEVAALRGDFLDTKRANRVF